jgi:peroxiredoxin
VVIVGVSFSGPAFNANWVENQGYQYEIWSDDDRDLSLYYGAIASSIALFPNRVTRVLNENGELVMEYNNVNVNTSPAEVLEDCEVLFGGVN